MVGSPYVGRRVIAVIGWPVKRIWALGGIGGILIIIIKTGFVK
jgi:hypothetical protein